MHDLLRGYARSLAAAQDGPDEQRAALLATERFAEARARYGAGLDAATRAGDEYEKARAHDGLARAYQASDDPGSARRHRQEALAIYNALGAPEAEQVRTQLDVTGDGRGKP
jgi:hypothetical protein